MNFRSEIAEKPISMAVIDTDVLKTAVYGNMQQRRWISGTTQESLDEVDTEINAFLSSQGVYILGMTSQPNGNQIITSITFRPIISIKAKKEIIPYDIQEIVLNAKMEN